MNKCGWKIEFFTPFDIVTNLKNDLFPYDKDLFENEIFDFIFNFIEEFTYSHFSILLKYDIFVITFTCLIYSLQIYDKYDEIIAIKNILSFDIFQTINECYHDFKSLLEIDDENQNFSNKTEYKENERDSFSEQNHYPNSKLNMEISNFIQTIDDKVKILDNLDGKVHLI